MFLLLLIILLSAVAVSIIGYPIVAVPLLLIGAAIAYRLTKSISRKGTP